MPRPKKPGAAEPKKRSRTGCWPCKARKVKCGEEKPRCANCERQGEACDYSIRLNWEGRTKRSHDSPGSGKFSATNSPPHGSTLSFSNTTSPQSSTSIRSTPPASAFSQGQGHGRSRSTTSMPLNSAGVLDTEMMGLSYAQTQPLLATGGLFDAFPQPTAIEFARRSMPMPPAMSFDQYQLHDYPSPAVSAFDTMDYTTSASYSGLTAAADSPIPLATMLPPMRTYISHTTGSVDQYTKRRRRSPSPNASLSVSDAYSPNPMTPLTPGSMASEDSSVHSIHHPTSSVYGQSVDRRLSVQSLLTGPPGDNPHGYTPEPMSSHRRQYPVEDDLYVTYGYDVGNSDLDTPKNDDYNAITIYSPPMGTMDYPGDDDMDMGYGSPRRRRREPAFEKGNYYAEPVPIRLAKSLQLPPILLENPMNLLYFHHFLNHTARILVPHDCEQNPFRQILPEMALHDDNIMRLLLAFSASHRARLLSHPEPANRIAVLVQNVFPKLRHSLSQPHAHESNSTLMTAIMLASLEIISPNTFEISISWQNHLTIARQMIMARGGPRSMRGEDRVAYFLGRWFAYLDVLGSLSGGTSGNANDRPLGSAYWTDEGNLSADEDAQIDCLLGFTGRCMGSLARIAELAKLCEGERIDRDGNIREAWVPSRDVVAQAEQIRRDLEEGLSTGRVYRGCSHTRTSTELDDSSTSSYSEISATNLSFHWAGLIHLYRRVLNRPPHHPTVQHAVTEIIHLLAKIRQGSTAEACLLFPMFTAGCDALEPGQRRVILERLRSVEEVGMTQVGRARRLMQRVWEAGRPWEGLVCGEFFG